MANKIKVKLILELRAAQMSQREICRTRHISQHSVSDVFKIAHEKNILFEDIKNKLEEEVYQMFFPDKFSTENLFKQPNYEKIHTELKKTGVTLKLLWYSYVEPCLDMKQDTWLHCNIHMLKFFCGSTVRITCDNLKTGVISHPREGDIILNDRYEDFGNNYFTAIMPAGVRKPKHKASVEGTVGKIATAIIAKLRNEIFHSMEELKPGVARELSKFNDAPFQKREGSRSRVFQEMEKAYLRETIPYEVAEWVYGHSVNIDCHVAYKTNRYSAPYQYIGKKVDLKVSYSLLEIYFKGERIASHKKQPDYVKYGWSTHPEDMPDQFQQSEWDDRRIKKWAYSIGNNTGEVIDRIFNSVKMKEQGYKP